MARDSALKARAERTGETVFSLYSWSAPTLSLGRNQPASGVYDLARLRRSGIDVVRRPTGGRAILHDREVTYSVTAPVEDNLPLRATYKRINRILQSGLSRLGVFVETASRSDRATVPSIRPCFEIPAEGELVAQGGKRGAVVEPPGERGRHRHDHALAARHEAGVGEHAHAAA
ncbi:MAG: biotin/lipoate A/B protein ligase family protein [Gemmatimonadaceae bacterium]